jgi:hypothetical protein
MPDEEGLRGLSENQLRQINFSTQILCYTLVTFFVILRLFLQRRLGKPLSVDDGKASVNNANRGNAYIRDSDLFRSLGKSQPSEDIRGPFFSNSVSFYSWDTAHVLSYVCDKFPILI